MRVLDGKRNGKFYHSGGVMAVSFSPNGELLASVGADGKCIIWDVKSKNCRSIHELPHALEGRLLCVAWSDSGYLALGAEDGGLEIWQQIPGRSSPEFWRRFAAQAHGGTTGGLRFGPEGKRLVTWSGVVDSWSVARPEGNAKKWASESTLEKSDGKAVIWDVEAAVRSGQVERLVEAKKN